MGSSFANLTRWLLSAGVALVVTFTAEAQQAGRRPGQPILFSSTDNGDVSTNMPSLAAKPPGMLDFANAIQSPGARAGDVSQGEPLPAPPIPAIAPAQAQQMQRLLDEKRNWALQTPEQILNQPTLQIIMGVPDRDAFGQPKNETVVEQYYKRQDQLRSQTNADNYGATNSAPNWSDSGGQGLQMNPNIWAPAVAKPQESPLMNQILSGTADSQAAPAQTPNSGWAKSFNLPAATTKTTPEQQTAMEQFQQLLQQHSVSSDGGGKTPVFGLPIFSPAPALTPAPPAAIPMGASYTPLSSGITMPAGAPPLPGLLGPTNAPTAVLIPDWKPQPPPWESTEPQLGTIPQRKF